MNLRIEPSCDSGAVQDHGHAMVNFAHKLIRSCCHDRARSTLISYAVFCLKKKTCDAHDGVVLKVDLERSLPLAAGLPFEEAAHYAARGITPKGAGQRGFLS